jgi:microcystin-dependent protein
MEPFLGEIRAVSFGFPPRGWAQCNGQLLPINQNQALFSILGTTYGGDGIRTFGLPDLRSRIPVSFGVNGPYQLGQTGGATSATLNSNHVPAHTHSATFKSTPGVTPTATVSVQLHSNQGTQNQTPGGAYLSISPALSPGLEVVTSNNTTLGAIGGVSASCGTVAPALSFNSTGSSAPINLSPPYTVLDFIIALQGIYPSRS